MKRALFIFILIISQLHYFSQRINGVIIDEYDFPLKNVTVINKDRNTITTSDAEGKFFIYGNENEIISFSYIGKKTIYYKIKNSDTTTILITLKEDIESLREFRVSGTRIKKVSAESNENIIDYTSLGKNTLLILKRKRHEYQLTIQGVDTVYKTFILSNIKPKELYIDFLGNIHLVCRDSIRQIHLGKEVEYVSILSNNEFDKFIKPTIYKSDSSLFVENFSTYNKKYTLSREMKNRKSIIYQSFDSLGSDYIDFFVKQSMRRPRINPAGNINVNQLRIERDLFQAKGFFEKILCKKLFVKTFSSEKTLLIFDLFGDSLIAYKNDGTKIYSKNLKEVKDLTPKYILQDLESAFQFYAVSQEKGIYSFYSINLLTGEPKLVLTLNELIFPKKIKIIEGWLYYLKPSKNGIHKLYRVKLES